MNAWASLSCLCITFWQVSIYSPAACTQKALSRTKQGHLLESEFFFNEVSFPGGPQPAWILLRWGREGAGCGSAGAACCIGRASPGPPQTRMPFVHWFSMCWSDLGGHTETGCSPPPSQPQLFSGLIFYLKLLSQEKFPRRGIIGNTWTCCDRTRGNSLKL